MDYETFEVTLAVVGMFAGEFKTTYRGLRHCRLDVKQESNAFTTAANGNGANSLHTRAAGLGCFLTSVRQRCACRTMDAPSVTSAGVGGAGRVSWPAFLLARCGV